MTFQDACRISNNEPETRMRRLQWEQGERWWQWRRGGLWSVKGDAEYSIDPNDDDMRGIDWVIG